MRKLPCAMIGGLLASTILGCSPRTSAEAKSEAVTAQPVERVEKVVATTPAVTRSAETPAADASPPLLVHGWPENDEGQTFEVVAGDSTREISLRRSPANSAPVVGTREVEPGETLPWTETRLRIVRPRRLRVVDGWSLSGRVYDTNANSVTDERVHATLEPGDEVRVFAYGGEGTCFLEVERRVLLASCPMESRVERVDREQAGRLDRPIEQEWWVRLGGEEGPSGWTRLGGEGLTHRVVPLEH